MKLLERAPEDTTCYRWLDDPSVTVDRFGAVAVLSPEPGEAVSWSA